MPKDLFHRQANSMSSLNCVVGLKLCRVEGIRIGHREMVRRDVFLHFSSVRMSTVGSGILFCPVNRGSEAA